MDFLYKSGTVMLLIAIAVVLTGCTLPVQPGAVTPAGYHDVTAQEARDIKHASEGKLVIIDLSPEYAEGHLPMAINILPEFLDTKIPDLDKSRPYLVYSRSDDTSSAGAAKLVNAGFSPVYRLKGNYESWVSAGFPAV
jgi:rhodanese-related sulfurtransferase